MKQKWKRTCCHFIVVFLLLGATLGIYTWTHWSPAASPYASPEMTLHALQFPLRNAAEHDAALSKNGGNPYVLEDSLTDGAALLYYGASHTTAPDHPQVSDIERRWHEFRPTVALCEGRARGYFFGALIEPFAGLPEPALVHKLARRDHVKLYSLEPAYKDEVTQLLSHFKPEQIALYFFLRVYTSESGGVANDALAADLLAKRTDVAGLRNSLPSLEAVDRVWVRDYPDLKDWRILVDEPTSGYLSAISDESRRIRGEHMLRTLIDLVEKGERVFAVVGSGHVIRQEWNLRAGLGMAPAWDQPTPQLHIHR